jgi:TolB-like protein/Flp pilus assembly protein TadD
MFTDMVGYTALMQEDEKKAKLNRDRHRRILQEAVTSHQGKILQYYGDGTLSIFNSAIEAVDCAIQIQRKLQEEPKIPLRIGMHTGDIVYDDEGIYGDGVNVASRIEGLATSGSVLISGKLFDDIKNHHAFSSTSMGTFHLKNVKKPIEVYAVTNEGLAVPTHKEIKEKPLDKVKTLAVLPFENMSPDPENEYFSDGITEELLNVLAQEEGLRVTARTSSFAFKGRHEDIKIIGRQLGAKTILEGSVRKAGNRVRITAQLINTSDGYHLWSETFDRQLDDIFAIQDEIAHKITNRLREKLTLDQDQITMVRPPTRNIDAYNLYLKGLFHTNRWTVEDSEIAIKSFQRAIDKEPDFALAWCGLSGIHIYLGASGKRPREQVYPKAKEYALKAVELDDQLAEAHSTMASSYFYYDWDWNNALKSFEKAIDLNPSYANAYLLKALVLIIRGETDNAIETMKKSLLLDPLYAPGYFAYASILGMAGRFQEALEQYDRLAEIAPYFPDALCSKGNIYRFLGKHKKAKALFDQAIHIPGSEAFACASLGTWYADKNQPDKVEEYLARLKDLEESLAGQSVMASTALLYAALDKPDEMFKYFSKSVESKEYFALYLRGFQVMLPYHSDPRFVELLRKMGLD